MNWTVLLKYWFKSIQYFLFLNLFSSLFSYIIPSFSLSIFLSLSLPFLFLSLLPLSFFSSYFVIMDVFVLVFYQLSIIIQNILLQYKLITGYFWLQSFFWSRSYRLIRYKLIKYHFFTTLSCNEIFQYRLEFPPITNKLLIVIFYCGSKPKQVWQEKKY